MGNSNKSIIEFRDIIMADGIDIKLFGAEELTKSLKAMPEKLVKKNLRKAFKKQMEKVFQAAMARVPELSGRLKNSFKIKIYFNKNRIACRLICLDPEVFYVMFIELGTSHAPAKPFLRPAMSETEAGNLAGIIEELNRFVDDFNNGK